MFKELCELFLNAMLLFLIKEIIKDAGAQLALLLASEQPSG